MKYLIVFALDALVKNIKLMVVGLVCTVPFFLTKVNDRVHCTLLIFGGKSIFLKNIRWLSELLSGHI